jgi:alanyl-tRNA synthetase
VMHGEKFSILNVRKMDKKVYLQLEKKVEVDMNATIKQCIDWPKRYLKMRYHTAAHILMGAVSKKIANYEPEGIDIQANGELCCISFDGDWDGSLATVEDIFKIANGEIDENLDIQVTIFDSLDDAIDDYGDIYRGPTSIRGKARLIVIQDWDANPCGGTHVTQTAEIGLLTYLSHTEDEICFRLEENQNE